MNRQKWIALVAGFGMIAGTAAALVPLKAHQRLGLPGVKAAPIPGDQRMDIYLPPNVPGYTSKAEDIDPALISGLPRDTSIVRRLYFERDLTLNAQVVMMGTDRTSIHKPQFCLEGAGWNISDSASSKDVIHMTRPVAYDLPVMKLVTTKEFIQQGERTPLKGIYVYWFVADGDMTNDHAARMRKSAVRLLTRGELERWAYISCFAVCPPGGEAATYERMKKFIAKAVPEFQTVAAPDGVTGGPQTALK